MSGGSVDGGTEGGKGPAVGGGAVTAAVGELIVTVQPKDAYVEVSGPRGFKATGRGRWESKALAAGGYTVKASAEGYESKTATAKVEVDEMTPLKVVLDKLGTLEVTGSPAGAKVEIAGPDGFSATHGEVARIGVNLTKNARADVVGTDKEAVNVPLPSPAKGPYNRTVGDSEVVTPAKGSVAINVAKG